MELDWTALAAMATVFSVVLGGAYRMLIVPIHKRMEDAEKKFEDYITRAEFDKMWEYTMSELKETRKAVIVMGDNITKRLDSLFNNLMHKE